MYLSVHLAARRLGVSTHSIRRWTDAGLLPCIRTAGGHRRVKKEDVDEFKALIRTSDQMMARLARERQVESLAEAAIAMTSCLDRGEVLSEIARQVTAALSCHYCLISDYDAASGTLRTAAVFDRTGREIGDDKSFCVDEHPLTEWVVTEQRCAVVCVGDAGADAGEVRLLRQRGDKTVVLVPLVHEARTVGLLKVYDHLQERRMTRQELRLAHALAGIAATAIHNAELFTRVARAEETARSSLSVFRDAVEGVSKLRVAPCLQTALGELAGLLRTLLHAREASAAWGGTSVMSSEVDDATTVAARRRVGGFPEAAARGEIVARVSGLELGATLPRADDDYAQSLLDLVAEMAVDHFVARFEGGRDPV
jgi:excisionase family DNA binding protein